MAVKRSRSTFFLVYGAAIAALLSVVHPLSLALPERAIPQPLCYGFLKYGEVWVSCNGHSEPITHEDGYLSYFAVSNDAKFFAFVRTNRKDMVKVFSLTDGSLVRSASFTSNTYVGADCGIIEVESVTGDSYAFVPQFYVPEGSKPPEFAPYEDSKCSSDRRTIVGIIAKKEEEELWLGYPPAVFLTRAPRGQWFNIGRAKRLDSFNISPNGRYVAYQTSDPLASNQRVCVTETGGTPQCLDVTLISAGVQDAIHVTDSGEVLFAFSIPPDPPVKGCVYKTMWNFSDKLLPGYEGSDECVSIAYWRPGMPSHIFLEPLGRSPQWLSPEQAAALQRWARKHKPKRRSRPS